MFSPNYTERANAYRNLATMVDAGMDLLSSLGQLARENPGAIAQDFAYLEKRIRAGSDLGQACAQAPERFSPLEQAVLWIGEKSGALPQVLLQLSEWFDFRHRINRQLQRKATYPLFVLHAGALIAPLPGLIGGSLGFGPYLFRVLFMLSWLYVPAGAFWLAKKTFGTGSLRWWHRLLLALPVEGSGFKSLALNRFYRACLLGQTAGAELSTTLKGGVAACGNTIMAQRLSGALEELERGGQPSDGLKGVVTNQDWSIWRTGETTGTLEKSLQQLSQTSEQEALNRLGLAAKIIPWLLFALVAALMVISIISGYTKVLNPEVLP